MFELTKALLLRVFSLAALCFGSLDRDFLLKRASERASSRLEYAAYLFLMNSRKSCVILGKDLCDFILFTIRKCAAR